MNYKSKLYYTLFPKLTDFKWNQIKRKLTQHIFMVDNWEHTHTHTLYVLQHSSRKFITDNLASSSFSAYSCKTRMFINLYYKKKSLTLLMLTSYLKLETCRFNSMAPMLYLLLSCFSTNIIFSVTVYFLQLLYKNS